jgi:hypothetical protein
VNLTTKHRTHESSIDVSLKYLVIGKFVKCPSPSSVVDRASIDHVVGWYVAFHGSDAEFPFMVLSNGAYNRDVCIRAITWYGDGKGPPIATMGRTDPSVDIMHCGSCWI